MSIIRPFSARLVHQDRARAVVTAMSDSLDEAGAERVRAAIDAAAYDESAPGLYVYRQFAEGRAHVGVVCEVSVQAFADGRVRGHEAVHPGRVDALVRYHANTAAPPTLVTLLHSAGVAFRQAVDATCRTPPILDFAGPGGLRQTVWRLADGPAVAALTDELDAAEYYVADGHHRVAAGLEEWRLRGKPPEAGLLCVVHPMDGLHLSSFHRRVAGPVDPAEMIGLLTPEFEVRAVPGAPAPTLGSFGLYVGDSWYDVSYRADRGAGRCGLDVAILQTRVLERLGRLTPGPSYTVEIAPARTSVDELTQRCDADRGALFTLAPPSLEVVTGLADAGEVMPPKTTYFEPKPCVGIFLRPSP